MCVHYLGNLSTDTPVPFCIFCCEIKLTRSRVLVIGSWVNKKNNFQKWVLLSSSFKNHVINMCFACSSLSRNFWKAKTPQNTASQKSRNWIPIRYYHYCWIEKVEVKLWRSEIPLPSPEDSLCHPAYAFRVTWAEQVFEIRLGFGYVTEMHWPRRPGKTPYRNKASIPPGQRETECSVLRNLHVYKQHKALSLTTLAGWKFLHLIWLGRQFSIDSSCMDYWLTY